MKDDTKAKIKALEYCLSAIKQVQRAKDPREKLAAVELEVEFTERIEALKASDREPALPFSQGEPALAAASGR